MPPRRTALFGVLSALLVLAAPSVGAQEQGVLVAEVDGPITPVVADYLEDAVAEADDGGYTALVVRLDTPGGLDISMREIVQAFLNADVPVIVYVSPSGARAASAGTFITMAAHVAAMAPGTSIGAATPVDLQGGEITDKIINDAVAFARSVAEQRGRNADFAEEAVRDGRSVTADTALSEDVVDLIAADLPALLEEVDGRTVELSGGASVTLDTAGATTTDYELGILREILGRLADPNLAFIFLSLGTLAVVYEAANPGMGFAGIAGVILLVLAFFSLSVLPVEFAGIALLLLAIALFVVEIFVPGVGVFAAGGAVALLLAGLFLFEEGTVGVSPAVLWPATTVLLAVSILAGRAAWRARRRAPETGVEAMAGRELEVKSADGDTGRGFLDGTWWKLRAADGDLQAGQRVRVARMNGLELVVEPVDDHGDREETT